MFNINYEIMFSVVGVLSFIGWGALAFSPLRHAPLILVARIISIILALIYTYLLVSLWGHEPKVDFSTLAGVASGFSDMGHLLTGWIHFLALDLFIGAWQVERAKSIGIPHVVVLPCLMLTFLVGPLGLFLFLMIQSIKVRAVKVA
jgi:putative flippase GtrA